MLMLTHRMQLPHSNIHTHSMLEEILLKLTVASNISACKNAGVGMTGKCQQGSVKCGCSQMLSLCKRIIKECFVGGRSQLKLNRVPRQRLFFLCLHFLAIVLPHTEKAGNG